ncbi:SUMF1/EgtB/PvdO family nonheme iron enzyme [Runella sp.]|uniref:formylglycine-generating enzyme family protein n=1 Tax=Runella sp. TaxID=1960881 RepID=UPI0030182BAA
MKKLISVLLLAFFFACSLNAQCCEPFLINGNKFYSRGSDLPSLQRALAEYKRGSSCLTDPRDNNTKECIELRNKIEEVERKIVELKRKEQERKDLDLWNSARYSYNVNRIIKDYLNVCELCLFRNDAQRMIDSLNLIGDEQINKLIREDKKRWDLAVNSNSIDYIRKNYLNNCLSPCLFRDSAQEVIDYIEFDESIYRQVSFSDDLELLQSKYLDNCVRCYFKNEIERKIKSIIDEAKPKMIFIKGGNYVMGNNFDRNPKKSDEKFHTVTVESFFVGKYEVTFHEYDQFCFYMKKNKPSHEGWGRGAQPAMNVSWYDAIEFCNWRSKIDKLDTTYIIRHITRDSFTVSLNKKANGYRLLTEAEWEYAARAQGNKNRYGDGRNEIDTMYINYNPYSDDYSTPGRGRTVPVGSLNNSNAWGLFDFSGNVSEWCWDWYQEDYYKSSGASLFPTGPDVGDERVARGGGHNFSKRMCTVFNRDSYKPFIKKSFIGFRIARKSLN